MPALIIRMNNLIIKTRHKSFVPPLGGVVKILFRMRHIIAAAAVILVIPCYVAQGMNDFRYGNAAVGSGEGSRSYEDEQLTNQIFGESNMLIVIVPNTNIVKEGKLSDRLEELPYVKSVTSMAGTLPPGIPDEWPLWPPDAAVCSAGYVPAGSRCEHGNIRSSDGYFSAAPFV